MKTIAFVLLTSISSHSMASEIILKKVTNINDDILVYTSQDIKKNPREVFRSLGENERFCYVSGHKKALKTLVEEINQDYFEGDEFQAFVAEPGENGFLTVAERIQTCWSEDEGGDCQAPGFYIPDYGFSVSIGPCSL